MNIGSAIARLFNAPPAQETRRLEPRLNGGESTRATAAPDQTAAAGTARPALAALPAPSIPDAPRYDLRNVSPREFADITHELYMEGTLNWDEFRMVGFPSELDPRYDETIGALTGEKARPDHPKDMLGHWEQRVEFERKYNPDADQVRTAENAVAKLGRQSQPPMKLNA